MILSCWWSDIPDAWSELRLCSFVGWVTRSVTGPAPVPWSLVSTTRTMEAHFGVVYSFSNTGWGAANRNKWQLQHFTISETFTHLNFQGIHTLWTFFRNKDYPAPFPLLYSWLYLQTITRIVKETAGITCLLLCDWQRQHLISWACLWRWIHTNLFQIR